MAKRREKEPEAAPITSGMTIAELIDKHPETAEVLLRHGFHCFGCFGVSLENVGQAAKAHGLKPGALLRDLNKAVGEKKKPEKK